MRTTFFSVWREGTGKLSHKHDSEAEARHEAKRLARNNPGQDFYVFKAVCLTRAEMPVETSELRELSPF